MNRYFLFCLLLGAVLVPHAWGQGLLPPAPSTGTVYQSSQPIVIGQKVPESVTVLSETGDRRTLQSYKSALEVLVVGFFSASCEMDRGTWAALRRLNDDLKDWRVAFVAVSTEAGEQPMTLPAALKKNGLPW